MFKRQLQWEWDMGMKICMLDWKQRWREEVVQIGEQRNRAIKELQRVKVIKNKNGNVMICLQAVLKKWKVYFGKLMNKKNDREPRTKQAEVVNKKVNCVSRVKLKNALRRMKKR